MSRTKINEAKIGRYGRELLNMLARQDTESRRC